MKLLRVGISSWIVLGRTRNSWILLGISTRSESNLSDIFFSIPGYSMVVALMSVLAPVAYIDFKELKIPNEYVLLGIIYWVLTIPLEIFKYNKYVLEDIKSSLVAAGVLFLAAALCKICIKGSIGAGDIKLFVVMGLLLGVRGIWGAMFLSLIVSFFAAIFFLITKKKSKKDEMAFGPALAIGTFLAIFLTGM